jgi:PAS domain S-box-containing protein
MELCSQDNDPEFLWDGSFKDPEMEQEFKTHTWARDCSQLHVMSIPVAISILAFIPIDAMTLEWLGSALKTDIFNRVLAALSCVVTFFVFRSPPKTRKSLLVPFIVCLTTTNAILYASASGANEPTVTVLCLLATTLIIWTFVPMSTALIILANGPIVIGFSGVHLTYHEVDYQLLFAAPILLILVNWIGFIYIKNRNTMERRGRITSRELFQATQDLKREIETRTQAEDRARANEVIFRSVFVSCPVPLSLVDYESGMVIRANARMTSLLGFADGELPDSPVAELFADKLAFENFQNALGNPGSTHQEEIQIFARDQSKLWILTSSCRITLPDQETILTSFVDITEQKEKEIQLAFASQEAHQANFAKSQFLANMSHELRTPLNAIIGFSDIIQSQVFGALNNQKYLDYIGDIKESGIHLLAIINEILDLSKIESGKDDLHHELIDLNEIISIALRLVRHHVDEKSIEMSVDLDQRYFSLFADQRAIKQVTLNLISNAIKFTPVGGSIHVHTYPYDGGVKIEISDTGIGIPEDKLTSIMEPFVQVENSLTNTSSGTGLGLPIAKRLVEIHGGSLKIESEFGKGTTVRFSLPITVDEKLVS